jgi:spore coat protein H
VHLCYLELGPSPWGRLAEGEVAGKISWDRKPEIPVVAAIRGAHSRRFPRKSIQVTLPEQGVEFGPPKGHQVSRIHLNADYIDPTLMRSSLSFWLFDQVGTIAPLSRYVALWVGGEFAGVYVGLESVDADFCIRRGWTPGSIYYAINRNANFGLISPFTKAQKDRMDAGYQVADYRYQKRSDLRAMVSDLNLCTDRSFPATVERWIDVDGYLRWLMVAVFVGNRDGFVHNYALVQDPVTTRFRMVPWDYDATWGIDIHGRPSRLDRVPVTGWNKLTHRLLATPRYRKLYKDLFIEMLAGPASPNVIKEKIDRMSAGLGGWIDKMPHSTVDQTGFERAVEGLLRWGSDRRELLYEQLRDL